MDPFVEVLEDAQHQITNLEEFLKKITIVNENNRSDFNNNISELEETISDLKESIQSSKEDPEFFQISNTEINKRESIVKKLEDSIQQLQLQWSSKNGNSNNPFIRYDETDENGKSGEANGVVDEDYNKFSQLQQEEMMREQDDQLDGVYTTMQNINLQARTMGEELEDQAYIIDEVDSELDRVGGKLGRGMRQVEHVIRKNQERAGDCCIGVLIVALIVLLVLVIVV
ncbi:Syntaxin-6 [Wickerhamomyces ciferrii]|uniref:t-SNARE affecting a late Golgi compartment protein 1 n=1 Tax=Wickerhamomyces ciferrii (strain ATCC 14091 / BCRC 22168 / CBS 111 / JCM 3599 / NBRC 0793 / NRRL Y-1031 F-60-10) TaxID=1206466 RepID=K0KP56_WICCF|nr:Syntaxin-6 [Wickerhamomyces ciferrii]CCH43977.1 Syntaxin-6 [Wickerhamomyces ciferrii]